MFPNAAMSTKMDLKNFVQLMKAKGNPKKGVTPSRKKGIRINDKKA